MRIQLANKGGKQADSFRLIFTQQGGTYQPTKMDWTCNFGAVWTTQQKLDMALQKAWFLQYPPVIKHGVLENLYLQMILPAFFTSISREFRKKKNKKNSISREFPGYVHGFPAINLEFYGENPGACKKCSGAHASLKAS